MRRRATCWRAKGLRTGAGRAARRELVGAGAGGPNGPDSEIYIDRGPQYGKDFPAGGPDRDDRYMETWNLVFMQYNRSPDGDNTPLPRPNIDTGMGLERLSLIIQAVPTVYETDLYEPIVMRAAQLRASSTAAMRAPIARCGSSQTIAGG